ncbi:MAG: hypothetical protein MSA15_01765 [Clostridium sp.]|nr:hypothetical protein [Clostridium sp.]
MLKVEIPQDKELIKRQIKALKYIIKIDKANNNMVDFKIHKQALLELNKALRLD